MLPRAGENTYEFLLLGIALLLVVMGSVIDWARVTLFHVPEAWCVEHIYRLGDRCVQKIKSKKLRSKDKKQKMRSKR